MRAYAVDFLFVTSIATVWIEVDRLRDEEKLVGWLLTLFQKNHVAANDVEHRF